MMQKLLKAGEAAELLKVSKRRVQQFCRRKQIKGARKHGRDWRMPLASITAFANLDRPAHRPAKK